jgi:hypothetical protein
MLSFLFVSFAYGCFYCVYGNNVVAYSEFILADFTTEGSEVDGYFVNKSNASSSFRIISARSSFE